jgi:hypothetical protein
MVCARYRSTSATATSVAVYSAFAHRLAGDIHNNDADTNNYN